MINTKNAAMNAMRSLRENKKKRLRAVFNKKVVRRPYFKGKEEMLRASLSRGCLVGTRVFRICFSY